MNNNNYNNNSNTQIPNSLPNLQQGIPNQNNINNNMQPLMPNQSNLNMQSNDQNLVNNSIGGINNQSNQYINYDISNARNETSINDLNVVSDYNQMGRPEYTNDPKVMENINQQKKNTIPVSKELKTVIIIALILLVFIIIIPMVFDFVNDIRFN